MDAIKKNEKQIERERERERESEREVIFFFCEKTMHIMKKKMSNL